MFFIVSTGRSGTTTISQALTSMDGCVCLHEPPPPLVSEASAYRYGELPKEELREILLKTRKPIVNDSVYCESNHKLSLIIPVLAEVFPEARYIWLIRNGLDVVASTYQKGWYDDHPGANSRAGNNYAPLPKIWVDSRIKADRCGDMTADEWTKLSQFGCCCWYWRYINQLIEDDLTKYAPNRYFSLRLEEIKEQLPALIDWMGFAPPDLPKIGRHNVARNIPYHWFNWSDEEWESFEYWCAEMMDRFYPAWRTATSEENKQFVAQYIEGLQYKLEQEKMQLVYLAHKNKEMKHDLSDIKNSRSWKVTNFLKNILSS